MRKIITILIMLLHVNTSMFIPVMEEVDIFDAQGVQYDDINSTYEFVDQVVLGNKDDTPEDEDDDHAHEFNVVHLKMFIVPRLVASEPAVKVTSVAWISKPGFMTGPEAKWASVPHEITGPPPKA
jgi:hypothetical protein